MPAAEHELHVVFHDEAHGGLLGAVTADELRVRPLVAVPLLAARAADLEADQRFLAAGAVDLDRESVWCLLARKRDGPVVALEVEPAGGLGGGGGDTRRGD